MPSWNWQGVFWVGIVPPQQMVPGKGMPENQYVPHVWVLSDGFPSKNIKIAVNAEHLSLWLGDVLTIRAQSWITFQNHDFKKKEKTSPAVKFWH